MKEIFIKHQIIIFRFLGTLMFLVAFVMFFWTAPKEGLSENEKAARNIARMEAKIVASSISSSQAKKHSNSPIMKSYKEIQAKQMRYLLIFSMILGAGFLGYSFMRKS